MTYDGEAHARCLRYPEIRDRLILLDGWSKTYAMTGWRLGWSVWPKPLYDEARKLAVNSYSCVNAAAQFAGIAALNGPQDCGREDARGVRPAAQDRGRGPQPTAGRVLHRTPKGAFYAFPNISRTGWKAKPLASALLEDAGVRVDRRSGFRCPRRRLSASVLRQLGRKHFKGAGANEGVSAGARTRIG